MLMPKNINSKALNSWHPAVLAANSNVPLNHNLYLNDVILILKIPRVMF